MAKKKSARKTPTSDVKILYSRAAGRCSFSTCRKDIVLSKTTKDKTKQIGKIAHIIAHGETGPRADKSYPKDKLDTYENWILLCSNCHDKIDAQHKTFTVAFLRKQKQEHENWVRTRLSDEMPAIGFAELEIVAKGLLSANDNDTSDFTIIKPLEKMNKNGLTQNVNHLLTIGLSRSREVEDFIIQMSRIDSAFSGRLITGFQAQYNKFCEDGLSGDALFEAMFGFASGGHKDFKEQAAGLAVLCHLFVTCEVFEK
ncbi:MAG TPA: HNH endonuclease signature motif containing protein [Alphaproteobacteria bacterium]|nr:HNH endonuclease signature motif containing protein [Alphaproteobacteria bacterium]